jgi:hypothetical protein
VSRNVMHAAAGLTDASMLEMETSGNNPPHQSLAATHRMQRRVVACVRCVPPHSTHPICRFPGFTELFLIG